MRIGQSLVVITVSGISSTSSSSSRLASFILSICRLLGSVMSPFPSVQDITGWGPTDCKPLVGCYDGIRPCSHISCSLKRGHGQTSLNKAWKFRNNLSLRRPIQYFGNCKALRTSLFDYCHSIKQVSKNHLRAFDRIRPEIFIKSSRRAGISEQRLYRYITYHFYHFILFYLTTYCNAYCVHVCGLTNIHKLRRMNGIRFASVLCWFLTELRCANSAKRKHAFCP